MDEMMTVAGRFPAFIWLAFIVPVIEAALPGIFPVTLAPVRLVRADPLSAGSFPVSFDAETATIEASCTALRAMDEMMTVAGRFPAFIWFALIVPVIEAALPGIFPVTLAPGRLVRADPLSAGRFPANFVASKRPAVVVI